MVGERKWVDAAEFQRFVGVAKLFPGPLASLVAIRLGRAYAGGLAGFLAGLGLILPAFIMILILARTAASLDQYPLLNPLWIGLSLAAIAISLQATYKLTKPLYQPSARLSRPTTTAILLVSALLTYSFPRLEAAFIIGSGLLTLLWTQLNGRSRPREVASMGLLVLIFLTCFRASVFTFGSGIAMVPVLRAFFIEENHWVNAHEFLRGLTLAQVTPGPLVIIATYLGHVVADVPGAVAATLGTFTPTFIFGLWLMPKFESTMLGNPKLRAFFDGLLPAVCGAIFGAMVRLLFFTVVVDDQFMWGRIALTGALTFVCIRWNWNTFLLLATGGAFAYFAP